MFELPNVVRNTLEGLPGIVQVLLLKRESNPKIFVVTDGKDLDRDREIVERLVQIEGIRSAIPLNYDVVTKERAHLIPAGARSVAD